MAYKPISFDHLLGIGGFSGQLLKDHFSLYQGYVTNTNKLLELLDQMVKEKDTHTPEYSELKRRLGWEFNGMRLHEYYFVNMVKGGIPLDTASSLFKKLKNDFGDFKHWEMDFKATGMLRGIGWAALCYDPTGMRLFNVWINEHDAGHLFDTVPLLIMDVFEHAYMTDYGLKRESYIEAFFLAIDWKVVVERFNKSSGEGFGLGNERVRHDVPR